MSDCYYDATGCLVCPEQLAQTYVPSRVETRAVIGWNAGANSIGTVDGDLHVVTDMPLKTLGAVIGLKSGRAKPTVPSLVEHGWYFQKLSGVNVVQPIERGKPVGTSYSSRAADTLFEIRRINGLVTYWRGTTLVYTSALPSSGSKVVNCCLYASGDSAPGAS